MKNFYISEVLLLSKKEKKAKRVFFDKKRTVIFWGNWTGKSSLIKSIYRAFGTEVTLHPDFKKTESIVLVRFCVDDQQYSLVRDGNRYWLFDQEGTSLGVYDSVSKELWPVLAQLFDFKLKLKTKSKWPDEGEDNLVTPPPAFLLLPFYIDQDKSWNASWSGFERLEQFPSFKRDLIDYHVGITTNEYYDLKEEILKWQGKIKESETEQVFTKKISDDIRDKLQVADFNIDIDAFHNEVSALLRECNLLKSKEENLKHELLELYWIQAHLEEQLRIVKKAVVESGKDYEYICNQDGDSVDCPLCWASYDNSFAERFAIAMDEDNEKDLLIELEKDLLEVNQKIIWIKDKIRALKDEFGWIQKILNHKKEAVELNDVLKSYGKNEINSILSDKIWELNQSLWESRWKMKLLEKELRDLKKKDKDRITKIKNEYLFFLKDYLVQLDIKLSEEDISDIHTLIEKKESGSAKPRALLAYYFAFFQLMRKYGSATYCPLIVDSPNQQAQDSQHIPEILKFIKTNQPNDSQLILWLEEFYDIDFECSVIKLETKRSLLNEWEFTEVGNIMAPFLKAIWL